MANRGRLIRVTWISLAAGLLACRGAPDTVRAPVEPAGSRTEPRPITVEPPAVRTYVAHRTPDAPRIDGRIDAAEWEGVAWTDPFVDIEGARRPQPPVESRVLMTWDDTHLYIGAALEEPHLQASLQKRDTIIFLDNDFEVFLDPDGDTHGYFELEVNALSTEWDLRLPRPYRDGGIADNSWDMAGLRTAVSLDGTLNTPSDLDRGWSVEIAIPFAALDLDRPRDGDRWRVNFSRVEWTFDTAGGKYEKRLAAATGRPIPESNWVWSPQYAVNMHMPELWGVVEFSRTPPGGSPVEIVPPDDERARWSLRRVYYAQRAHRRDHGGWAGSLDALGLAGLDPAVDLVVVPAGQADSAAADAWRASIEGPKGDTLWIRADGLIWKMEKEGS